MENKDSKIRMISSGAKRLLLFLWPFAKKEKPVYNLKSISIPRTSGRALKILLFLLRIPVVRLMLLPLLLRQAGLPRLRKCHVEDAPVMYPFHPAGSKITSAAAKKSIKQFFVSAEQNRESVTDKKSANSEKQILFQPETASDFHLAYLEGKTTPVDVAMRLLDIIRSIE